MLTGKCELLRLANYSCCASQRTHMIEYSLRHSKNEKLRSSVLWSPNFNLDSFIRDVIIIKNVSEQYRAIFKNIMDLTFHQLHGYQMLCNALEKKRSTTYSKDDPNHEETLIKLWKLLYPDVPLKNRISKQWCEIGFQGDDPASDFRGMGLLGLETMMWLDDLHDFTDFSVKGTWIRRLVLFRLQITHQGGRYPYALVSINITQMAYTFLLDGTLKNRFYNTIRGAPSTEDFYDI
ncbi:unnamed protein product, partial [Protopolystoma xenopodis]